jgi:hypothetical protein
VTTAETIERVWREESARVVGALARITRDLSLAEELAQDALVAALEEWPRSGVPDRPGAWLTTTAKHRALNALKRSRMIDRKHAMLVLPDDERYEPMPDDALRLIFTACHGDVRRHLHRCLDVATTRVILSAGFDNPESYLTPTTRRSRAPTFRASDIGFRCARTPQALRGTMPHVLVAREGLDRADAITFFPTDPNIFNKS